MVEDETKWQKDKLPVIGNLSKNSMSRVYAKVLPLHLDHPLDSKTGKTKLNQCSEIFSCRSRVLASFFIGFFGIFFQMGKQKDREFENIW